MVKEDYERNHCINWEQLNNENKEKFEKSNSNKKDERYRVFIMIYSFGKCWKIQTTIWFNKMVSKCMHTEAPICRMKMLVSRNDPLSSTKCGGSHLFLCIRRKNWSENRWNRWLLSCQIECSPLSCVSRSIVCLNQQTVRLCTHSYSGSCWRCIAIHMLHKTHRCVRSKIDMNLAVPLCASRFRFRLRCKHRDECPIT